MTETELLQTYIKRAVKICIHRDDEGKPDWMDSKRLSAHIDEIREIVSIACDIVNGDRKYDHIDEGKFQDSFTFKVTNVLACEILDQFAEVGLE